MIIHPANALLVFELILLFNLEFQSIFKYAVFGAVNNLVELGEI